MNISVTKENFLDALGIVGSLENRKSPIPFEKCVKITANEDGTVELVVHNIESWARDYITMEYDRVNSPGVVVVPIKELKAIVKSVSKKQEINIYTDKSGSVFISWLGIKQMIEYYNPEEYPIREDVVSESESISIPNLYQMLSKTSFAVSTDLTRGSLDYAFLECTKSSPNLNGYLSLTATNGHILSSFGVDSGKDQSIKLPEGTGDGRNGIFVSRDVINLILKSKKFLADQPCTITYHQNKEKNTNSYMIDYGTLRIVWRVEDLSFPRYQQIIPNPEVSAVINTKKFLNILSYMKNSVDTINWGVELTFVDNAILRVRANNNRQVTVETFIAVSWGGRHGFAVGFNVNYLIDFLNIIETEMFSFGLVSNVSASKIQEIPTNGEKGTMLGIVMPLRLENSGGACVYAKVSKDEEETTTETKEGE